MHARSLFLASFVLLPCLILPGCGAGTARSPEAGEVERYLQENPEAAIAGQEEPEGFDGPGSSDEPTEFPGQDEQ